MLVYIDDSGDPGFKIGQGSSAHFVLAMVRFEGEAEAEDARARLLRLREALGFSARAEFKFNKSSRAVRERFLRALAPAAFTVRSLVLDKTRPHDPRFRQGKAAFYDQAVREAMQHYREALTGARVRLDGSAEREYRRRLQRDLRRIGGAREVRLVRSQAEPLIQLADMIAGATRLAHLGGRTDAAAYRALIAERIVEEWVIPA
jgi:hypothetical protein